MRISDWSSDVCSSDLEAQLGSRFARREKGLECAGAIVCAHSGAAVGDLQQNMPAVMFGAHRYDDQSSIGNRLVGIEYQVEESAFELLAIAAMLRPIRLQLTRKHDVGGHAPPQHRIDPAEDM